MPSATTINSHIPAWKRLGLKLKSTATDQVHCSIDGEFVTSHSLKRKRPERNQSFTPQKAQEHPRNVSDPTSQAPITPNSQRKKSVTFTQETKLEDGDSIKQLFNSWAADQKAQDPSFDSKRSQPVFETPTPWKIEEHFDTSLNEKERRVRRVKKPIGEPTRNSITVKKSSQDTKPKATSVRPFLQYLKQYHESRATWKFNKNHQSQFLKHIFNPEVIPSEYAYLIPPYVRGLQGAVRTRLRDEAIALKLKDIEAGVAGFPEDMADKDTRQAEYDAAMKDYVATKVQNNPELSLPQLGFEEGVLLGLSDAAMKDRVAKRLRAEAILQELSGSSELDSRPDSGESKRSESLTESGTNLKRLRMNDGSTQKIARKRKQRTRTLDESSSSSESSEDEDESTLDSSTSSSSSSEAHSPLASSRRRRRQTASQRSSSDHSNDSEQSDDSDDDASEEENEESDSESERDDE